MCMSFFWGCSVQPHLFLYSRVSFRIHFHDLHRRNAGTHLKNWSALRHHTTTAGDAFTTNAIKNDSGSTISHVAIYIGGGQIVHASNSRDGIKVSNAFYRTPICCRRML